MKLIFTILLLCQFKLYFGQDFTYPAIRKEGKIITDFVPKGWIIKDSVSGELNNDNNNDLVLIFQLKDSISILKNVDGSMDTLTTHPRILALFFKDKSNTKYILAEQSNTFILTYDDKSKPDPLNSIKIEKGILLIEFLISSNIGSWYTTNSIYQFKYMGESFSLIGAECNSSYKETLDYKNYDYDFIKGQWCLTEGNNREGSNQKIQKECYSIELNKLKNFQTFKEPFTWEIVAGVFL